MPCVPLPKVTPPPLPSVTFVGPAAPPFKGDINICCKIFSINIPPTPFPLPPIVISAAPALVALIRGFLQEIQDFEDKLPLKCPLE